MWCAKNFHLKKVKPIFISRLAVLRDVIFIQLHSIVYFLLNNWLNINQLEVYHLKSKYGSKEWTLTEGTMRDSMLEC